MGEAGSGKDFLLRTLLKLHPEWHGVVSCTTRPPREGEVNGEAYHFLEEEEFLNKVKNNEMFEHVEFRGWYYGTGVDGLCATRTNVGVFNVEGIRQLASNPRVELKVYWVAAAPKTRLLRQLTREENPNVEEIVRRFRTDEEDFATVDFDYETVSNDSSSLPVLLDELDKIFWAE